MDSFLSMFANNKFERDDREPQFFVSLPLVGTFGIANFSLLFWLQSFILLMIQSIINIVAAIIIYKFIVQQRGTLQAYLIGYGIVCPLLAYTPFVLIGYLDLRNIAFMLCLAGATVALLLFRCLEAMHGTLPAFAEESLGKFVLYYSSTLQFNFDEKTGDPISLTGQEIRSRLKEFCIVFVETTLCYSILLPCHFNLFPRKQIQSLADLYYWGNIANNYIMASLTSLVMEGGATGLGLLTSLFAGFSTTPFNDNPLTKSSSPSDFWGRRWNKIIAPALRRGVIQPVRQMGWSRHTAAIATFIASGLLHEYVLLIMALRKGVANNPTQTPYKPVFGNHLIFFAWNGIVLLLERALADTKPIRWISSNLPQPVKTFLVLLTVVPIAHLFTDEYVASGFYSDVAFGFPRIFYLGNTL